MQISPIKAQYNDFTTWGGNLGDIYHEHIDFLIKLTIKYPENRIVVFPQTVFYNDRKKSDEDLKSISSHRNIYICARDKRSYETIKPYFKERALLVPDMAFCIPLSEIKNKMTGKSSTKELFLLRKDGELNQKTLKKTESWKGDILDWPTFYHKIFDGTFIFKFIAKLTHWNFPLMKGLLNRYCAKYFHKNLFNIGVSFLSPYHTIYTTRLHGCILGIMMGKKVHLIDNSYGKNSTFYNTWLKDIDNVTLL